MQQVHQERVTKQEIVISPTVRYLAAHCTPLPPTRLSASLRWARFRCAHGCPDAHARNAGPGSAVLCFPSDGAGSRARRE